MLMFIYRGSDLMRHTEDIGEARRARAEYAAPALDLEPRAERVPVPVQSLRRVRIMTLLPPLLRW